VPRTSSQRVASSGSMARSVTAGQCIRLWHCWRPLAVLTRMCVPSKLHHTGCPCGWPSGMSVARDTTMGRSRRSRYV
jgi:hypothetical protein